MTQVPIKTNPKLFDLAVSKLQTLLANNLPWLDYSFGICEKLTDIKNGQKFTSANLYIGKNKYKQIMPCSELGNFSFFMLKDPQEVVSKDKRLIKSGFSFILWYDVRETPIGTDERDREAVKVLVLNVLGRNETCSWVSLKKIYERPENIFADFTYDFTNNQYLMSPYAGLRIDGEMIVRVPCGIGDYNIDFNFDFFDNVGG